MASKIGLMLAVLLTFIPSIISGGMVFQESLPKSYVRYDLVQGPCSIDYSSKRVSITIGLQQQNLDQLEEIFWAVSTPSNPSYGAHLSFDRLHDLIEPDADLVEEVTRWLISNGVSPNNISRHDARDHLSVRTTIGVAERMFNTKYALYTKDRASGKFLLRATEYEVPENLGVRAVFSGAQLTIEPKCDSQIQVYSAPKASRTVKRNYLDAPAPEYNSRQTRNVGGSAPDYVDQLLHDIRYSNAPYPVYTWGYYQPVIIRCLDGSYADGNLNCANGDHMLNLTVTAYNYNTKKLISVVTTNLDDYYKYNCHIDDAGNCDYKQTGWGLSSSGPYWVVFNFAPPQALPQFTPVYFSYYATTSSGAVTSTLTASYIPTINYDLLSIAQLKSLYGIPMNLTATNPQNSQGVIEFLGENFSTNDISIFMNQQGLPDYSAKTVVSGPDANNQTGQTGEGQLDMELIMAIGLNVTTYFYLDDSPTDVDGDGSNDGWLYRAMNAPSGYALVQSISWGLGDERQNRSYYDTEFIKAGARGISIITVSGDGGPWDDGLGDMDNINFPSKKEPAPSAYVTVVGATMVASNGTGLTEWMCSSQYGAFMSSGSGLTHYVPQPSYQNAKFRAYVHQYVGEVPPFYNLANRAYPDVVATGFNIQNIFQGVQSPATGTSASCPVFAGVIALLNDIRLNQGQPPLGFLNPLLYALPSDAFNDITMGNSACVPNYCSFFGFPAAPGYDIPTGLGSPNFAKMAQYVHQLKNSSASATASVASTSIASSSTTLATSTSTSATLASTSSSSKTVSTTSTSAASVSSATSKASTSTASVSTSTTGKVASSSTSAVKSASSTASVASSTSSAHASSSSTTH